MTTPNPIPARRSVGPTHHTQDRNFIRMRRAVRSEHDEPLHGRPDWQAAIADYLQRGGADMEIGDLQQLFREACEHENIDY